MSTLANLLLRFIIISLPVLIVLGNNDIPCCKEKLETLKYGIQKWKDICVDENGNDLKTAACKELKLYNKEMMKLLTQMCFYKGKNIHLCKL